MAHYQHVEDCDTLSRRHPGIGLVCGRLQVVGRNGAGSGSKVLHPENRPFEGVHRQIQSGSVQHNLCAGKV